MQLRSCTHNVIVVCLAECLSRPRPLPLLLQAAESLWASQADDSLWASPTGPLPCNWSIVGSMWFTVTVFTTIGYGTYTPQTPTGQLVVVVFATFGIPIFGYLALLAGTALNGWVLKLQARTHIVHTFMHTTLHTV